MICLFAFRTIFITWIAQQKSNHSGSISTGDLPLPESPSMTQMSPLIDGEHLAFPQGACEHLRAVMWLDKTDASSERMDWPLILQRLQRHRQKGQGAWFHKESKVNIPPLDIPSVSSGAIKLFSVSGKITLCDGSDLVGTVDALIYISSLVCKPSINAWEVHYLSACLHHRQEQEIRCLHTFSAC